MLGSGSALNYSGFDINAIDSGVTLTLDNSQNTVNGTGTFQNFAQGQHDGLSGSLQQLLSGATLNIQNNADLTLTSSSFTSGAGQINITNNSVLDVTGVGGDGSGFQDITSGTLNSGANYLIGLNSALKYAGSDITTLNGNLTLDSSVNSMGAIQNTTGGAHDALSASLSTISGTLALQNGANLELSNSSGVLISQGGTVSIDAAGAGNSSLTVDQKLTNYNSNVNAGSLNSGSGSTLIAIGGLANKADDTGEGGGQALISLVASNLTVGQLANSQTETPLVTSNLFNGAFTPNGGTANAEIDLGYGSNATVTGNVKNIAALGFFDGGPSSTATINLYGRQQSPCQRKLHELQRRFHRARGPVSVGQQHRDSHGPLQQQRRQSGGSRRSQPA